MTLSEFRSYTSTFSRKDVRRAIAAVLPGRTFLTQQQFRDFYEAVCRELQTQLEQPNPDADQLVA